MQRVPYFSYYATVADSNNPKRLVVQFKNNGVEATEITYTSNEKHTHYDARLIEHRRRTDQLLQVEITDFEPPIENVEFWINSVSPQHISVTQRVHKFPG